MLQFVESQSSMHGVRIRMKVLFTGFPGLLILHSIICTVPINPRLQLAYLLRFSGYTFLRQSFSFWLFSSVNSFSSKSLLLAYW